MLEIQTIKELCMDDSILMTQHVARRCQERAIAYTDLINAIRHGEIIEQYPNDYPYPSCLILGDGPLHIVVGVGQDKLWVITAYRPSIEKWAADWKTRKAGENV